MRILQLAEPCGALISLKWSRCVLERRKALRGLWRQESEGRLLLGRMRTGRAISKAKGSDSNNSSELVR